jgi:hypothetical protein
MESGRRLDMVLDLWTKYMSSLYSTGSRRTRKKIVSMNSKPSPWRIIESGRRMDMVLDLLTKWI